MKEVSTALRDGYLRALRGNVTMSGVEIPVFDEFLPKGRAVSFGHVLEAYIILTNQTDSDASAKQAFNSNCSIQVSIFVVGSAESSLKYVCEQIANQVLQIVIPSPQSRNGIDTSVDGFNLWYTRKESDRLIAIENKTERIFQKILIFSHKIEELINI